MKLHICITQREYEVENAKEESGTWKKKGERKEESRNALSERGGSHLIDEHQKIQEMI